MKYLFVIFFIGLLSACSSVDKENIKQEVKSISKEVPTKVKVEKQVKEETDSDTVYGYKIGYHDNEKKYKYYYKEIIENGNVINQYRNVLNSDSLLISGKLNFETSKQQLQEIFGQPDSVEAFYNELEDSKGEFIFYRNIKLIMYSYDSIVRMGDIEFKDSSTFIQYGKIEINSLTSLSDFEKLFPLSFINSEYKENPKGDNSIKKTVWIRFSTKEGYPTEDQFIFSFHDGKLNNMWYWVPM